MYNIIKSLENKIYLNKRAWSNISTWMNHDLTKKVMQRNIKNQG